MWRLVAKHGVHTIKEIRCYNKKELLKKIGDWTSKKRIFSTKFDWWYDVTDLDFQFWKDSK